jgi:hypothetical protein
MSMQANSKSMNHTTSFSRFVSGNIGWVRSLHISDGKPLDCATSMKLIDITCLAHGSLKHRIKNMHLFPSCERLPRKPPNALVGPQLAQILGLGNEAQRRRWGTTNCLRTACDSVACISTNVTKEIGVISCSATLVAIRVAPA